MELTKEERDQLLQSQQSELNGVETYLRLADAVNNEQDKKVFRQLAADEGRHANVFKAYTGEVLAPKKPMAYAVVCLYRLIGKRALYPFIARFEYAAIPKYEKMMEKYPEVECVKNDEKRHGDTVSSLIHNGEYKDKPLWPFLLGALLLLLLVRRCTRRK